MNKLLIDHLSNFVTERRMSLFEQILNDRTRYITVVLEDIYQSHNASAVLRSCDVFGIQDVHIIENKNKYTVNPDVTLGSDKWLNITKYSSGEDNTEEAINKINQEVLKEVEEAVKFAKDSPFPAPEETLEDVYAD